MSIEKVSHERIVREGQLTAEDIGIIKQRRLPSTRLGFAYQLVYVRLVNYFPAQQPMEIEEDLLTYVALQLGIQKEEIERYQQRQPTITEHRQLVLTHLGLTRFEDAAKEPLESFLLEEATRVERIGALLQRAKQFLEETNVLFPSDYTLRRLIVKQRQAAREHVFSRVEQLITPSIKEQLDALLVIGSNRLTPFQALKKAPGRPSPPAILRLTEKLTRIRVTGVLDIDLSWLNNNYQRFLTSYARRCSADRLRKLGIFADPPKKTNPEIVSSRGKLRCLLQITIHTCFGNAVIAH